MAFLGCYGWLNCKQSVLPTFCPNDYFWEHHWNKDKEEKHEAFARVMREIIANHIGYKTCEMNQDDKAIYVSELKNIASGGKTKSE